MLRQHCGLAVLSAARPVMLLPVDWGAASARALPVAKTSELLASLVWQPAVDSAVPEYPHVRCHNLDKKYLPALLLRFLHCP
ncbi:MAG TPA: hypothetical protein PKC25_15650, partial [Candidatus Rifleibacterium sp.]|nr:hypothetical protein [Candidatus Rifleibacterium sp.]